MKDWKDDRHHRKWDKASIFLATNPGTSSFQSESLDPGTHNPGLNLQSSDENVKYHTSGHTADIRRPGSSDIARLAFRSPWPLIFIELISGDSISERKAWIYSFKHIVVYEKQIRKCCELLNETSVDDMNPKDLPPKLYNIISEVIRMLGPKREEVEISHTYISNILQKRRDLNNHHAKVKKSSPEDPDEDLEDDNKTELGLRSNSPFDGSTIKDTERTNMAPEGNPVQEKVNCVCTCLRDARDQLQLLVNTMDSYFGSLLLLHKAIRDGAVSRISFEHLWHLF